MKHKLRYILCMAGFIVLFCILYGKVSYVLQHKVHVNDTIGSFYKEPKKQMDVLFVGSSHAFQSFSPMHLWNETGIASYNLGTPQQTIPCTYYVLKEGIRLQAPKVVVLETYGVRYDEDYKTTSRLHEAVDNIPFNGTKIEILTDFLPHTLDFHERLEYAFPIIKYHSRWDKLSPKDLKTKNEWLRGFQIRAEIRKQEEPEWITETAEINARTIEYLDKIIKLCEENNIELIFVQAPMAPKKSSKSYEEAYRKLNSMPGYAEEMGIPYLNFDDLKEEIHLDYALDFKDQGHVNLWGAEKATEYIGTWLKEHYDLPDHRGEQGYEKWETDYKKYSKSVKKQKKKALKK